MMIYPTIITPRKEPEIEASPPSAINEAANTDVPINTPPTIRRIVVMVLFSLIPTPKATKKSMIVDKPKIIPLSFSLIGKNPTSPCPTAASIRYVNSNTIAATAVISEIFFLADSDLINLYLQMTKTLTSFT